MNDLYAPCPCGSGKKFKWCCEPIFGEINKAFEQAAEGQHEIATRLMAEVCAKHPTNAEVWGRQAQLLAAEGKLEDAEVALEKAFAINPTYPFGLLLRAQFRFNEGEVPGALLLARKAADAFAPEAAQYLAEVQGIIVQCETAMHRPIAARAALRTLLHLDPSGADTRGYFDSQFGPDGMLPACVRREYTLLPPTASLSVDRRAAWDRALKNVDVPRLGELARLFDGLTKDDANDASAWFNLGLCRAWLGDNRAAVDALNRYVELSTDDAQATVAATLTEVLRCGSGLENDCDYHEYSFALQLKDPAAVNALLGDWQTAQRLAVLPNQQEGSLVAMVVEYTQSGIVTAGSAPSDVASAAVYFGVFGNVIRVWGSDKDAVGRLREEMRPRLNIGIGEAQERTLPGQFFEVPTEALIYPFRMKGDEGKTRVLAHAAKYYEETWMHKPRRSLGGSTPDEAMRVPVQRKKLSGVIQFIEDCAARTLLAGYDFNNLRRECGFAAAGAAPVSGSSGVPNIAALNADELAALPTDNLTDEHLEQAFQAAQKQSATEPAKRFGKLLTSRPPRTEKPDRYYLFSYLTQLALKEGETDAALDLVNEGESQDCTHNEGRRRNDYELRRGQVHAKRGEADQAEEVFRRLIERVPTELGFRTTAAESMLNMKQAARALRFAEEGLVEARKRNNRDIEGHLMELTAAAKKQMG